MSNTSNASNTSNKTAPAQSSNVAKVSLTETKPETVIGSTTHADKAQTCDKAAAANAGATSTAAVPKNADLQLQLTELASEDSSRRTKAAEALGRTKDAAAVPALIVALRDGDADVAREAAASLGVIGNAAAVEPLIAVLDNANGYFHSVVRIAATQSLGQLRDSRAVESLLYAIKDPIAEASCEAIRALASLNDPRSLPAILEVVRNEHGFYLNSTRHAAILGLAKIGGEQAKCELRFVSTNQWEDATIRSAAIEATREGSNSAAKGA